MVFDPHCLCSSREYSLCHSARDINQVIVITHRLCERVLVCVVCLAVLVTKNCIRVLWVWVLVPYDSD